LAASFTGIFSAASAELSIKPVDSAMTEPINDILIIRSSPFCGIGFLDA
jgi:hypothetical protein